VAAGQNQRRADGLTLYRFVVTGLAAGSAVHEAVDAQAHVELGLAERAVFLAPATRFRPLALGADDSAYAWFRGHGRSLVRPRQRRNVTEVTEEQVSGVRSQVPGKASRASATGLSFWFS